MRLINVYTLEMREFTESQRPPYAILSHCWNEDELLLKDLPDIRTLQTSGVRKVLAFCNFVKERHNGAEWWGPGSYNRRDTPKWVWIDTCCIDKTSSAELSEAINSMFKWYKDAFICIAYISDVNHEEDRSNALIQFRKSRWFTRGWCLQELIAPAEVIFCDKTWRIVGNKSDPSISKTVSEVTDIDCSCLTSIYYVFSASVAKRMSWAARRETTREEDMAYCLMGIFGVNMPLLYGEGAGAFTRLQREIINTSDDQSIFAWTDSGMSDYWAYDRYPVLATHPKAFAKSRDVHRVRPERLAQYAMTNRGLRFETRVCVIHDKYDSDVEILVLELACAVGESTVEPGSEIWHDLRNGRSSRTNGLTLAVPCMLAFRRDDIGRYFRYQPWDLDLSGLRNRIMVRNHFSKASNEQRILFLETSPPTENAEEQFRRLDTICTKSPAAGEDLWRHLFPRDGSAKDAM